MNNTNIEWTDLTWNPVSGCNHGCSWCYARRMAYRLRGRFGYPEDTPFKPTFHSDKLQEPYHLRGNKKIFTVSMGDFFDKEVKEEWREAILDIMWNNKNHIFQLLTKVPQNIDVLNLPPNLWLGVSVTKPDDIERMKTLVDKVGHLDNVLFVSLEPYLERVDFYDTFFAYLFDFDWLIIGGLTGRKPFKPSEDWLKPLIDFCVSNHKEVFVKNNIDCYQEFKQFPSKQMRLSA